MKRRHSDGQGGATRLELALATVLTALLAGMLLNRLAAYQGETERVAAKQLVASLRTALALRSADFIARGDRDGLMTLTHQNPMSWLQKTPKNYLGEYYSSQNAALQAGNWYFDRSRETLVYLPAAKKSFSHGIQNVLIFKVKSIRVPDPVDASGRTEVTTGLVLDQIMEESLALNNIAVLAPRPTNSEKK